MLWGSPIYACGCETEACGNVRVPGGQRPSADINSELVKAEERKGVTEPKSGLSNWILVIKKNKQKNGSRVRLRARSVCVPARVLFKGRDLIGFCAFLHVERRRRARNFNAKICLKGFRTKGTVGGMEGEGRRYRMR